VTRSAAKEGAKFIVLAAKALGRTMLFEAAHLMPPLIPDRRYLTEKNQTALARFAERIGRSGVRFE